MKSSIALSLWTSSLSLMMTMPTTVAFSVVVSSQQPARVQTALDAQIGVFFGTSTGSTEEVAELIQQAFGDDVAAGPFDIDALDGSVGEEFAKHDALIVGTPTWNTGADTERSGTGWDEVYYGEMQDLQLDGKKVAVFGLGDSVSYAENYADASGELHDVLAGLGCQMMGYVPVDGYVHEASKAQRGDRFVGLMLDAVNFEDLTEERVNNWVEQLKGEGFLEGASSSSSSSTASTATAAAVADDSSDVAAMLAKLEQENAALKQQLEQEAAVSTTPVPQPQGVAALATQTVNGETYSPHVNAQTGRVMWVSSNGKSCYYTNSGASANGPLSP